MPGTGSSSEEGLLAPDHALERGPHVGQELLGGAAVEGPAGDAGDHLAAQSGHLDLEELVDPLGEEDEELHPLEQGQVGLGHQVEQPVVEVEVGELAGEVPATPARLRPGQPRRSGSSLTAQR